MKDKLLMAMGPPNFAMGGPPCDVPGSSCIPIDNGLVFLFLLIIFVVILNFKIYKNEE